MKSFKTFLYGLLIALGGLVFSLSVFLKNPVFSSYKGEMASLAKNENLKNHVSFLTSIHPPRNIEHPESLNRAAEYIFNELKGYGFTPAYQNFEVNGKTYKNVIATLGPENQPLLITGAHYDCHDDTPGADDNASGVAGLLEAARILKNQEKEIKNNIEFVFYTLEEPPAFRTANMGSAQHAQSIVDRKASVKLMVSIEMIGYFDETKDSQSYPLSVLNWWFPTEANFIALVGKIDQWSLMRGVKKVFKKHTPLSVQSLNAPRKVPGIDFSDHLNYWDHNFPAVMLTDTAFFRNANYHELSDTPSTLNFDKMTLVVEGLVGLLKEY